MSSGEAVYRDGVEGTRYKVKISSASATLNVERKDKMSIPGKRSVIRVWRWIKDQIVQDVPQESALCEYDCRKGQCTAEEWETCERRLNKAQGELMPARTDTNPG